MTSAQDQAASYLMTYIGPAAASEFQVCLHNREQRTGQALMNVLRLFAPGKYGMLTGSLVDPFYVDANVPASVEALINSERE